MLRCPTCLAILIDTGAKRCYMCGTNLRRRSPTNLAQSAREAASLQVIDLRAAEGEDDKGRSDVDVDETADRHSR